MNLAAQMRADFRKGHDLCTGVDDQGTFASGKAEEPPTAFREIGGGRQEEAPGSPPRGKRRNVADGHGT